jgi:hypothetical protein
MSVRDYFDIVNLILFNSMNSVQYELGEGGGVNTLMPRAFYEIFTKNVNGNHFHSLIFSAKK